MLVGQVILLLHGAQMVQIQYFLQSLLLVVEVVARGVERLQVLVEVLVAVVLIMAVVAMEQQGKEITVGVDILMERRMV